MYYNNSEEGNSLFLSKRSVDSLTVLIGFCDRDKTNRDDCYLNTTKLLSSWYHGFGSPKECSFLENTGENGDYASNGDTSMYHLIDEQVPDILRLSVTSPLEDVRDMCQLILQDLRMKGLKIPRPVYDSPSCFVPLCDMEHMDRLSENDSECATVNHFREHFYQWCRLENYITVIGYHPDYLESFMKVQDHLLRGDCPLPYPVRHYICIMAAARHKCEYLIHLHASEFLSTNGDPKWLEGINLAPAKLRSLAQINRLLAHRPWLITKEHVAELAQSNDRDKFTLSELMHAFSLMTHTHALASFIFCCGVLPEIDHPAGHSYRQAPGTPMGKIIPSSGDDEDSLTCASPAGSEAYECPVEELMDRMKRIRENELEELDQEELLKRFQTVENQNAQIPDSLNPNNGTISAVISRFITDANFSYESFKSSEDSTPFRMQDYSWSEDAINLVNHLSSDLGFHLDEKFTKANELTYFTMGDRENVDTSSFRTAVWNYVHSLFGLRHDDYNYAGVEQLLQRPIKTYLKMSVASPESIRKQHYDAFMHDFKHSEKIHVNLVVFESRFQASLLYAVRAIDRYCAK